MIARFHGEEFNPGKVEASWLAPGQEANGVIRMARRAPVTCLASRRQIICLTVMLLGMVQTQVH